MSGAVIEIIQAKRKNADGEEEAPVVWGGRFMSIRSWCGCAIG